MRLVMLAIAASAGTRGAAARSQLSTKIRAPPSHLTLWAATRHPGKRLFLGQDEVLWYPAVDLARWRCRPSARVVASRTADRTSPRTPSSRSDSARSRWGTVLAAASRGGDGAAVGRLEVQDPVAEAADRAGHLR